MILYIPKEKKKITSFCFLFNCLNNLCFGNEIFKKLFEHINLEKCVVGLKNNLKLIGIQGFKVKVKF